MLIPAINYTPIYKIQENTRRSSNAFLNQSFCSSTSDHRKALPTIKTIDSSQIEFECALNQKDSLYRSPFFLSTLEPSTFVFEWLSSKLVR